MSNQISNHPISSPEVLPRSSGQRPDVASPGSSSIRSIASKDSFERFRGSASITSLSPPQTQSNTLNRKVRFEEDAEVSSVDLEASFLRAREDLQTNGLAPEGWSPKLLQVATEGVGSLLSSGKAAISHGMSSGVQFVDSIRENAYGAIKASLKKTTNVTGQAFSDLIEPGVKTTLETAITSIGPMVETLSLTLNRLGQDAKESVEVAQASLNTISNISASTITKLEQILDHAIEGTMPKLSAQAEQTVDHIVSENVPKLVSAINETAHQILHENVQPMVKMAASTGYQFGQDLKETGQFIEQAAQSIQEAANRISDVATNLYDQHVQRGAARFKWIVGLGAIFLLLPTLAFLLVEILKLRALKGDQSPN